MTPENKKPDFYTVPTVTTDALETARHDADTFANQVRAENAGRHIIDVEDIPGIEQPIEVRQTLGGGALKLTGGEAVPIAPENVTPQMMRNAIGSPYRQDEAGRIVPKESHEA